MGNGSSVPDKCTYHEHRKEHHRKCLKGTDANKSSCRKLRGHGASNTTTDNEIASATNPFIIFYLRLRKKKPTRPVSVTARVAGKLWTNMTFDQKQKYINLANAEKKRRNGKKRRRKMKIRKK